MRRLEIGGLIAEALGFLYEDLLSKMETLRHPKLCFSSLCSSTVFPSAAVRMRELPEDWVPKSPHFSAFHKRAIEAIDPVFHACRSCAADHSPNVSFRFCCAPSRPCNGPGALRAQLCQRLRR